MLTGSAFVREGASQQQDEEPQDARVEGVPGGFLRRGDCGRAEYYQRAGGAYVHELGEGDALSVLVEPGDQDAHGGGGKNGETLAQFCVGEAGPADFFEESGEESESDADPEAVWRVDGRYERFEAEKNAEDQNRRNKQGRVPTEWEADAAHSCVEIF